MEFVVSEFFYCKTRVVNCEEINLNLVMVSLVELELTKMCKEPITWSFMYRFFTQTSPPTFFIILFFPKGYLFSSSFSLKTVMCLNKKKISSVAVSFCGWQPAINLKKRFYWSKRFNLTGSLAILLGGVLLPSWTLMFYWVLYFFKDSCFFSKVLLECDYSSQIFFILKELLYSKKFCCSWELAY